MLPMLSSLLFCCAKPCPNVLIVVKDDWRSPPYDPSISLFDGLGSQVCTSQADFKKIIMNQAMCNKARQDMVDLLDTLNKP
jgi:hypothetical protein